MNIEELKTDLQDLCNNNQTSIVVFVLMKNGSSFQHKKLNIEKKSLGSLKALFTNNLNEKVVTQTDISLLNLSESDERSNAIYLYDLEIPEGLACLEQVLDSDNLDFFNFKYDNLANVKAFIIKIGNHSKQVVLYKTLAPVNVYGRSSFFLGKKDNERFEKIEDEFLRISPNFQFMRINDLLLIFDLKTLEKFFGFHDVITREARNGIQAIKDIDILEDSEILEELIVDVKYARKFTKIAKSSPVIKANIPNESIIKFCKEFPKLKGKIRFNSSENKIRLDTKISKDLFIQLLMDNFLTSELTSFHYTSVAKDVVDSTISDNSEDN
jgi:hypothetical protein